MKKMSFWMACVASLSLISFPVNSDQNPPTESIQTSTPADSSLSDAPPVTQDSQTKPVTAPVPTDPTTATTPVIPTPAAPTAPTVPTTTSPPTPTPMESPTLISPPASPSSDQTQPAVKPICSVPQTIDVSTIQAWAQEAAIQLFSVEKGKLDDHLKNLEDHCFTSTGYASFIEALKVSKNLDAINSLQLAVSSSVDKTDVKDNKMKIVSKNMWRVTVPLTVVYQNDKNKLTQSMSVDITVTKTNDKLGIEQVIASLNPATLPASSPLKP